VSDPWDLSDVPETFDEDMPDDALDAFTEEQRSAITSTDVAKILGLSRWGTALTVYASKVSPPPARKMGLPGWLGNRLEGLISELFTSASGLRVRADNGFHRSAAHPCLGTHLDRRVVGRPRSLVELKSRGSRRGWGEDGSAKVPPDVWLQVQHEMYCTGATECFVAVLFSTQDYRTYRLAPDPKYASDIVPVLVRFWDENVERRVPPPPTGAKPDTDYLSAQPGGHKGSGLKSATPGQERLVGDLRLSMVQASIAALTVEEKKNLVKAIIGEEYEGLAGSFGTITWRRSKDRVEVDWEAVASVYRKAIERLGMLIEAQSTPSDVRDQVVSELRIVEASVATAVSLYTTVKPGSRPFLVSFKED
jgi:hypothetical protein